MGFSEQPAEAGAADAPEARPPEWTVAGRGPGATEAYDCGHDLIVLDEHMPGSIPGTAAMVALRGAGCEAVIAGFSGNCMEGEHRAAGADLSWSKPLPKPAELAPSLMAAFKLRGYFA